MFAHARILTGNGLYFKVVIKRAFHKLRHLQAGGSARQRFAVALHRFGWGDGMPADTVGLWNDPPRNPKRQGTGALQKLRHIRAHRRTLRVLECGGKGAKGARHRFSLEGGSALS